MAKRAVRQTLPRAFINAFVGIRDFAHERNSRIQTAAGGMVIAMGVWLRPSLIEWGLLTTAMFAVLSLEAMNCAVERVVDLASPGFHELARQAKDLAAAAVLIASAGAAIIGALIFVPKLIAIFR